MFSIPVFLQVLIPIALLVRHVQAHRHSFLAWLLSTAGLIAYFAAIAVAGLWLFVPWYVPFVYLAVLALSSLWHLEEVRTLQWMPRGRLGRLELAMSAVLYVAAATLLVYAGQGRRAPNVEAVHLSFPLKGGTYYVANGGRTDLLNSHAQTLRDGRYALYRGQGYATDFIALGDRDRRASGVRPIDPQQYASFREPVYSPCGGLVLRMNDSAPDMPVGTPDPAHVAGNFVLIDCGTAQVLLGHFRQGSLQVQAGDTVARGELIAEIGNSGNSGEPHLHVHAQRAATDPDHFMAADPLPVDFDGRFLARNDIVRTDRIDIAGTGWTETQVLYAELVSAIVGLLMLIMALRSVLAGRILLVVLFGWAAVANIEMLFHNPLSYLDYGPMAVSELYRQFIFGFFAQHVTAIVAAIAAGQGAIAVLILLGGRAERVGLFGAIAFLCAITPLGVYAGFPATLIMAMAATVVLRENWAPVFGRLVRATRDEIARRLPGDELIPVPTGVTTHAVTIACRTQDVWPWLAQMGAGRAGWYSYDVLDNGGRHSAQTIVPELQQIQVGTLFAALPGAKEGFFVQAFEQDRMLMLVAPGRDGLLATWTFFLEETAPNVTRLIVRARIAYRPLGLPPAIGIQLARMIHFVMERKQLVTIASRVEHRRQLRAA